LSRILLLSAVLFLFGCNSATTPPAAPRAGSISVLTQHNDNARTGANLRESELNVADVNKDRFGKLFDLSVDGDIYSQPLYVAGVDVPGKGRRNLIYITTMHNSVYAFDADRKGGGDPIWVQRLGIPVPTSVFCDGARLNIRKEIGIISTPVISMQRQVLYTAAFIVENGEARHYIHALDLATGQEKFNGPKRIQTEGFIGGVENQRPALLLSNDTVYVGFGSYGDCGPFHGWMFGFNADTLESSPRAFTTITLPVPGNGIWQGGQGPAADAEGNIYLMVGNGTSRDILPPLREPAGKVTFKQQALGSPAAIDIGARLLIAWTAKPTEDPDEHVKVATWRNETTLTDAQTLADTSLDSPALASGNGRTFLAWTENDSRNVNRVYLRSTADSKHWSGDKSLIPDSASFSGPALAFGNGRLFAAWTDKDKNVVVRWSVDGIQWLAADRATLPGPSAAAPQLAFIDDELYLLWTGIDHAVNLMQSPDGKTFSLVSRKWKSSARASLVKEGPFWLAWARGDSTGSAGLANGRTPAGLGDEITYQGDFGLGAPTLVALGGALHLLWSGSADSYLNIARIAETPALANSFVKLRADLSLSDWFMVWNTDILNRSDVDLGAAGPLLLPGTDLLIGGGKEGKMYLLQRNNLGGFCAKCGEPNGDSQIPQWFQAAPKPCEISPADCGALPPAATFYHIHGSPVYWDGPGGPFIYIWSEASNLRRFKFENGRFVTTPVTNEVTTPARSMPGAMLSLSANGNDRTTGIIWTTYPTGCTGKRDGTEKDVRCADPRYWGDASAGTVRGTLRAFDATSLKELWNSDEQGADTLGFVSKFAPPTIVNGKVYVSTFSDPAVENCQADGCRARLVVYGLKR
jgi:outer membrane protein assembly factor BamB